MSAAMRIRLEAEQRAITSALRQMKEENPNYGEEALLSYAKSWEKIWRNGYPNGRFTNFIQNHWYGLSWLLEKKSRRSLKDRAAAHQPSQFQYATGIIENPAGVPSFALQPYSEENLQALAQRQAMTEYKQQALNKVKAARQRSEITQTAVSTYDKRRKLKELLVLPEDKISPKEYYERRALIMGPVPTEQ